MAQIDIVAPIVVGGLIGIVVSLLFVQYGKVNTYQAYIFGINSNNLITGITLFLIISSIAALSGMSAIIKDLEFITSEPLKFFFELLAMGLLPTLACVLVIYLRTNKFNDRNRIEGLVLFIKFAALHVLLQISGYYRHIFNT